MLIPIPALLANIEKCDVVIVNKRTILLSNCINYTCKNVLKYKPGQFFYVALTNNENIELIKSKNDDGSGIHRHMYYIDC